jgi:hypothetical protein
MNRDVAALDLPTLLVPESLRPVQFAPARCAIGATGERALMLAVLEDAIRCLQEHRRGARAEPRRLAREAEAWIRSDAEHPFSFVDVCDTLDIPVRELRAALLAWRVRPLAVAQRSYRLNLRAVRRRVGDELATSSGATPVRASLASRR